jgi:hypothetical protein
MLIQVALLAGLLFSLPASLTAQERPSDDVEAVFIATLDWLEARSRGEGVDPVILERRRAQGIGRSESGNLRLGGLSVEANGEDVQVKDTVLQRVARRAGLEVQRGRWVCIGADEVRSQRSLTLEFLEGDEAIIRGMTITSMPGNTWGAGLQTLRLKRQAEGWQVEKILLNFSMHGDCDQ